VQVPFESSSVLALAAAAAPAVRAGQGLSTAGALTQTDRNQRLSNAVALHFDTVWRMLRRLGVPEADADDAAQGVFLALDKRLLDVPLERERGFLLSAAVRVAANARRQLRRSREDAELDDQRPGSGPTPEHALEQRQALAELDQALTIMSDDQRTVFVLYEIEGFSLPEIARSLDVPLGTATSRLRRARDTFEAWLAERRARGERP
jgi:RNA polymerase sigma-70 factor (ECF subfamily)